ncbi:MAG: hypothetical protein DHS20C21_18150 [Gemmatimonadota bacterium]|nr:MAG: hypothetical protein DHS20C21_18150 [Gemmatimonadota bacterium]
MLRFAIVLAAVLLSPPAFARTWLIHPDGTGDAPTIQAAVDSTAMGDTIYVTAGEYEGPVRLKLETHLVGEPPRGSAAILGPPTSSLSVEVFSGTVSGLRLGGVGGTGYGYAPTVISSHDAVVQDCILESSFYVAESTGSLTILDCEIRDCAGGVRHYGERLEVRRCTFETDHVYETSIGIAGPWLEPADLIVTDCVFRQGTASTEPSWQPSIGWLVQSPIRAVIAGNLFLHAHGPAAAATEWSVVNRQPSPGRQGQSSVEISGNTIVGGSGAGLGNDYGLPSGTIIHGNAFVGNETGLDLTDAPGAVVTCNLSWGNAHNWAGSPDPTGIDGNLSASPLFCDYAADNFTAAANSPLLAPNNECGLQIGAFGQGCGPVSVTPTTWGAIKGAYR